MRLCLALAVTAASLTSTAVDAKPAGIVGAYRLVHIEETQADGRVVRHANLKGSLIYTAEGRMSVQVSSSDSTANNDYVHDGYEASFGRFTLDAATHRVTHHVEAANVSTLVGRNLPRTYQLVGRRLVIGPVSSSEHWRVTWEKL